jgi:hypothetical protein
VQEYYMPDISKEGATWLAKDIKLLCPRLERLECSHMGRELEGWPQFIGTLASSSSLPLQLLDFRSIPHFYPPRDVPLLSELIRQVGKFTGLRRLKFAVSIYDFFDSEDEGVNWALDLKPLSGLRQMEQLDVTLGCCTAIDRPADCAILMPVPHDPGL